MSKKTLSTLSDDELQGKLKTSNSIAVTTTSILVVIILAWVVLGYWKTNVPVFISTICVAVVSSSSQFAIRQGLRAEINRRRAESTDGSQPSKVESD